MDLGIGTIIDVFHWIGSLPKRIEQLKRLVIDGAMLEAVSFSILAETLSGPLALETSRLFREFCTSSTVQYISSQSD